MNKMVIQVFDHCGPAGSGVEEVNAMFNLIESKDIKQIECIEFSFDQVRVISTKFSGRFLERISKLRTKRPDLKIRVENATRGIESAFEYQNKLKK